MMNLKKGVDRWDLAVVLVVIGWFFLFLGLSILQIETHHDSSIDLALHGRSLWGIIHGHPANPLAIQHGLALPGQLILYLVAPLTYLFKPIYVLLSLQSLTLSGAGLACYFIAARRLDSKPLAFCLVLLYLLCPITSNTLLSGFHAKTLAMPFLLIALDRVVRIGTGHWLTWVLLLISFACHQTIALMVGCLGLLWLLNEHRRKTGLVLALFGGVFFITSHLILRSELVSGPMLLDGLFGEHSSWLPWKDFFSRESAAYLIFMACACGILPVLGAEFALVALLPIMANLFCDNTLASRSDSHFALLPLPFMLMGAIKGIDWLRRKYQRALPLAISIALCITMASYLLVGAGPMGRNFRAEKFKFTSESTSIQWCLSLIPRQESIMAPIPLAAELSDRLFLLTHLPQKEDLTELSYIFIERAPLSSLEPTEAYLDYVRQYRWWIFQLTELYHFRIMANCGPFIMLIQRPKNDGF